VNISIPLAVWLGCRRPALVSLIAIAMERFYFMPTHESSLPGRIGMCREFGRPTFAMFGGAGFETGV